MNFGPVEEQNLTYVALKCITQMFLKKRVCTYKTTVSHFYKNNKAELLCSAQNH